MVNSAILVGRLTRDPELQKSANGTSYVRFTVAVNRQFNRDETDFIGCVAFGNTADFIGNYLNKGSLVSVEGRIETGRYEDNTGRMVYTTDIIANRVQSLESRAQRVEREKMEQLGGGQSYGGGSQNYGGGQFNDPAPKFQQDPAPRFEQDSSQDSSLDEEPVLDITSDDLPF